MVSRHNFEINCLTFLFNGIKKYKNLPRVVFLPITKDIDMDEIDCAIVVERLIREAKDYFRNFQSIDLKSKNSLSRKEIKLCENDLILAEITFIHPSKDKLDDFLIKFKNH